MSDTINYPLSAAIELAEQLEETPETNKAERMAYSHEYMVPTEFTRKLERERDEAKDKYATEATEHMLAVNKLCGERDEARADCLEQARLLGMGSEREAKLISERDEARKLQISACNSTLRLYAINFKIKKELDDARNAIVGWENKWKCAVDMAARAEIDRNDILNKLKDIMDKLQ